MRIIIHYFLNTDGDFCLNTPDKFGCINKDIVIGNDFFDYVGTMNFQYEDETACKRNAKDFLERFLCDGISVASSYYYLVKDFYNMIDQLIDFIDNNTSGIQFRRLSGNYSGTIIIVEFV